MEGEKEREREGGRKEGRGEEERVREGGRERDAADLERVFSLEFLHLHKGENGSLNCDVIHRTSIHPISATTNQQTNRRHLK